MSEWAPKRFWTQATVVAAEGGWSVALDGRPVRTPAKTLLAVPTRPLAASIASEWQAQVDRIDPASMPHTRMANSALDKLAEQRAEVADMLAAYGDSDLLCYRADRPQGLVERQAAHWDPMLDWAAETLGARLEPRTGIMHAPQDARALARLREQVHALDDFRLAAFHDLVTLTGSLVLAFAAIRDRGEADTLWALSRLDETWQEEQWGRDEEAAEVAEIKRRAFADALRFYRLAAGR